MWGHAYVESNDAIVLYACCAMHHVDFSDVTRGAWALLSPAQVDSGSASTILSGNCRLKPEKKEYVRRDEWVPIWRTLSPFVKEHIETDVISEYPWKNQTRSRIAAVAQGLGATANAVRQNRRWGMPKRQSK